MKLKSDKHNRSIYLPVHSSQKKCLTVCPSLTSLASCAFRLSVWTLFLLFSFPSNLSHFYLSFHAFWDLRVSWSKQVFKYCVHFFFIWWLLSPKERVQWALHLFPFYFGSRCNSLKEDRYGSSKQKAAILYPTIHFVSSRTQTFTWQEKCQTLFTCLVLKYLPLASLRLFQGF